MNQEEERLQKIIANRGYGSRRNIEKLISAGRVKVDGEVVTQLGFKTRIDAHIEIDNREVVSEKQKYYFLFNKPRLVLTTMYDPKGRKTVAEYTHRRGETYVTVRGACGRKFAANLCAN